jgi:hypothetical protein
MCIFGRRGVVPSVGRGGGDRWDPRVRLVSPVRCHRARGHGPGGQQRRTGQLTSLPATVI